MNRFSVRRLLLVAGTLLIWLALFRAGSADFLRNPLALFLARFADNLGIILTNIPDQIIWLALLALAFLVCLWLLLRLADHFFPHRQPVAVQPDPLEPVQAYATLLREIGRGAWFERQASARLADLALQILGEREPLSRQALADRLNREDGALSPRVRAFLLQGLRTGAPREEASAPTRLRAEVLGDVQATLAFLEAQTGGGEPVRQ